MYSFCLCRLLTVFPLLFFCFQTFVVNAQNMPAGFSSQAGLYSGGSAAVVQQPVGLTFSPDGLQLFVTLKEGKILVSNWDNTNKRYVLQSTPVIDISNEVGNWADHGMLGFALDPNFASNGLIYMSYVVDRNFLLNGVNNPNDEGGYGATIGRITRYQTQNSGGNIVADLGTRFILMGETKSTGLPILSITHGVGDLEFGSDGTLIASLGDGAGFTFTDVGGIGGSTGDTYASQAMADEIIRPNENVGAYRSQMLNSMSGKILRIDPATGNGLPSNPYYDAAQPKSIKSRIWALGFRNPFRFSFKPNTGSTLPQNGDPGTFYISDVGWVTREEITVIDRPGINGGWPIYEGVTKTEAFDNFGTIEQSYGDRNVPNYDEPNPLYGIGGCTQQYFYFKDLIKDPTADNNQFMPNPCDNAVAIPSQGNTIRFVHHRPILDWKHFESETRIPVFNGNNASWVAIESPQSPVNGIPFNGFASIGGVFYKENLGDPANLYPPQYDNTFFMYDYNQWMRVLTFVLDNTLSEVDFFAEKNYDPGNLFHFKPLCMAQSPQDGWIYYVNAEDPSYFEGKVNKFVYGGNIPPTASINISNNGGNNYGAGPLSLNFSSTASSDPDGSIVEYDWDFGDGTSSTSANPSKTYNPSGSSPISYTVTLRVRDDDGSWSDEVSMIVSVNNTPPSVSITSPVNNSEYPVNQINNYTLTATVSDAEHSAPELAYNWQVILHHNTHNHPEVPNSQVSPSVSLQGLGCDGETYYYEIVLTVTDAAGLATTRTSTITPNCSSLPVTLLSFKGMQHGAVGGTATWNILTWKVHQTKVSHYEIERSNDGIAFEKIGVVSALSGSTGYYKEFTFTDVKPVKGNNYYRLKMVDLDGAFKYSMILNLPLRSGKTQGIKVYPVPFNDNIVIESGFSKSGDVQVQLVDVQGRVIRSRKEYVIAGTSIIGIGNLQNVMPGVYFVNVLHNGELQRIKVVKGN